MITVAYCLAFLVFLATFDFSDRNFALDLLAAPVHDGEQDGIQAGTHVF